MTRFSDGHQKVPVHLVNQRDKSHGLIIYYNNVGTFGTDFTISGNDSGLVLEQISPSKTTEIPYTGDSIKSLETAINISNMPFNAIALNEAINLATGELNLNTSTPNYDGGYFLDLKRHIVKYNEETRIRVSGVSSTFRRDPWYPRIDLGKILKEYRGKTYLFSIPEYEHQLWHAIYGKPYRQVIAPLTFLADKKYSAGFSQIYYRDNNIKILTDLGVEIPNLVSDVDENNGYIYIKEKLSDSIQLRASLTIKENSFIYKDINLNPAIEHNPGVAGRYVLIYLKPAEINPDGVVRKKSIYHAISNGLLNAISSLPKSTEPILILGAYHIRQTNNYKDTNILDTRSRGGGIKDSEYESTLEINKNVYSSSDVGFLDGVPYPGSSVIIAEIPEEIKEIMTVAEIKRRITKHVTLGVDTLLEFE
jgi:hypothetical protein